jgi:hypothetical protein
MLATSQPRPRTLEELAGPELLGRLDRLDILSRRIFAGKLPGERRSKKRGQSVEFDDYRPYVPGDDLRHIDWNVFARLDRLFIKLFREEEDLALHLVIDGSASMDAGDPPKIAFALQLAMALGYIGLVNQNRLVVTGFGVPGRPPLVRLAPMRGRPAVRRLAHFLTHEMSAARQGPGATGEVSIVEALRSVALARTGKGVMVILSDLLTSEDLAPGLNYLASGSGRGVRHVPAADPGAGRARPGARGCPRAGGRCAAHGCRNRARGGTHDLPGRAARVPTAPHPARGDPPPPGAGPPHDIRAAHQRPAAGRAADGLPPPPRTAGMTREVFVMTFDSGQAALRIALPLAAAALLVGGCAARPRGGGAPGEAAAAAPSLVAATGEAVTLEELTDRALAADVVIIGEEHDNQRAQALAADLWERVLARQPEPPVNPALALEFFERDQQLVIDDYLAGIIPTARAFERDAGRTEGNYPAGHKRMLEAAKAAGRPVIAANVPRRYASYAREQGLEALKALPQDRQALFTLPQPPALEDYQRRFNAVMKPMLDQHGPAGGGGPPPASDTQPPAERRRSSRSSSRACSAGRFSRMRRWPMSSPMPSRRATPRCSWWWAASTAITTAVRSPTCAAACPKRRS